MQLQVALSNNDLWCPKSGCNREANQTGCLPLRNPPCLYQFERSPKPKCAFVKSISVTVTPVRAAATRQSVVPKCCAEKVEGDAFIINLFRNVRSLTANFCELDYISLKNPKPRSKKLSSQRCVNSKMFVNFPTVKCLSISQVCQNNS